MAKHERMLRNDVDTILARIDDAVLQGSSSARLEDSSDRQIGTVRCAVRVYERFSMVGGNRVSLSLTAVGDGTETFVSAITSGGSQAVFFKINTMGEQAFLRYVVEAMDQLAAETSAS